MLDPAVLPGFVAAVVLVTVAPGPDNAFIAAVALDRGVRAGLLSAVGMALGMVVHVTATALGLALVLQSAPAALDVVRLLGATYLAWLAFTTLRPRAAAPRPRIVRRRPQPPRPGGAHERDEPQGHPVLRGLPPAVRTGHGRPDCSSPPWASSSCSWVWRSMPASG